jgi:hypothetical protein
VTASGGGSPTVTLVPLIATVGCGADGAAYDPAAGAWRPLSTRDAPASRRAADTVWTGRDLVICGGYGDRGRALGGGACYDPRADAWRPLAAAGGPRARRWGAVVWTRHLLVVWGGAASAPPGETRYWDVLLRDGAVYDPVADAWGALPDAGAPAPRSRPAAVWTGEELLIWGGSPAEAPDHFEDGVALRL